jgi:hypothetical protein
MHLKISAADLRARISQSHFANEGDSFEQQYWPVFKERFPNLEKFWQSCVVPMTTRIEQSSNGVPSISRRDVAIDLWQTSFQHYSAFLHLIYAVRGW